jgi:sodium/bile acid cotransporter 7
VAVIGLLLFSGVMLISGALARSFGFSWEDQIAVMFCGSKKSMATGVPMAQVMFAASPALGLLILPLLLYHTLQLVLAGTLAARWSKR